MAKPLDQFLGIFKGVSGQTGNYYEKVHGANAGEIKYFESHPENQSEWRLLTPVEGAITVTETAIGKSSKTKIEDYFSSVIDQTSFNTDDYNRLRNLFIDLFATFRTKATLSSQVTDPHSLPNSDLDELFRSFGFNYSTILRGVDENPLEQKVQLFLDLVNLYKIKGTPRSLVEVLQYFGIPEIDIYEFFLKLNSNGNLVFDGTVVAGTTINPPGLIVPYVTATIGDPHWIYTESQIKLLNSINKINLPSKSPYIGVAPQVSLENAESSLLQRLMQDQYSEYINTSTGAYYEKIHGSNAGEIKYFKDHPENNSEWVYLYPAGGNLTLNAEITFYGEVRSFLELYLATIYKFNSLYFVGDESQRFLCYDGSNSNYAEVSEDFSTLSNTVPSSRIDQKLKQQQYLNIYSRLSITNFLVDRNSCGNILKSINPVLKNSLDLDVDPYQTLASLLSDVNRWVRNNLGLGFINFGFVLFGIADFFRELKPVIDFFKPYRTRLLLFESLQINSRLLNSIIPEDSFNLETEVNAIDFITSNSSPCCTVATQYAPSRPILVGVTKVPKDSISINVLLSDVQLTTKYGVGLTLHTTDLDPSCITCGVQYKSKTFFTVIFSNPVDTDNFYLNWTINSTERGGEEELLLGETQKTVTFLTPRNSLDYSIVANVQSVQNVPDVFVTKIIGKTLENFTAVFSSPLASEYHKLNWIINENVFGNDIVSYGDSIKTVNIPLQSSTDYPLIVDVYDTINSENVYSYIIYKKTTTSFDIRFSDVITDSPYFFSTLIVNWFIPSTTDDIEIVTEYCGDDISQLRYARADTPPVIAESGIYRKIQGENIGEYKYFPTGQPENPSEWALLTSEEVAWKGFWKSNNLYSVNDGIALVSGKHYYCIKSSLSLPETRPETGSVWTEYWIEYSYFGTATDQTGVTFYSRETFDCGSNYDLGAVSDFRKNIFIEIQDTKIDRLKCVDSTDVTVVNEVTLEYGNIICGVQPIPFGATNAVVVLPKKQPGIYSVNATLQILDPSENVSVVTCGLSIKSQGFFVIELSDPVDSDNWSINWSVNTSDNAGVVALEEGITEKRVSFSLLQTLPNYSIATMLHCYELYSDVFVTKVLDKTNDGFTVVFSSPLPSNNFELNWSIDDAHYGNESIPSGVSKVTVPLGSYTPDVATGVDYPILIDFCDTSRSLSPTEKIISGVQEIPLGVSTVTITLPESRVGSYAVSAALQNLDSTLNTSIINLCITEKTADSFTLELSALTDTSNWSVNWSTSNTVNSGSVSLESGIIEKRVTLPLPQSISNYSVVTMLHCFDSEINIFTTKIIDKTPDGFTVVFSGILPSNNFNLDWSISTTTYGSEPVILGTNKVTVPLGAYVPDDVVGINYPVLIDFYDATNGVASIYSFVISEKTLTDFTVTFSGVIDSSLTYICWAVPGEAESKDLYSFVISEKTLTDFTVTFSDVVKLSSAIICWAVPETQTIERYRQTSGFTNFDEPNVFDCPYTNDIIEILQEVIIQGSYILLEDGALMLQEDGFALFLE